VESSIVGISQGKDDPNSNKNTCIDGITDKHGSKIIPWFRLKGERTSRAGFVHDRKFPWVEDCSFLKHVTFAAFWAFGLNDAYQ
jgi:hypothetical protein